MTNEERILDAIVRWESLRGAGQLVTVEELCPEDPALWDVLRLRIEKRRRLIPFLVQATTPAVDAAPPATLPSIPGYEILEAVGQGGMGIIYKARQLALNRTVAVKMLLAEALPPQRERFRAEAEAIARLEHPNINRIYQVGEVGGRSFLVLEWADGGSLAQYLEGVPLPSTLAASIVLPLARAVTYAHERGIVHRDIKPANVLLAIQGPTGRAGVPVVERDALPHGRALDLRAFDYVPKIADFGLAKRLDDDHGRTQTGAILGTPSYMAPEQAEGRTDAIGPLTDVHALGAMLYELLTGRPPFVGETVLATLEQVKEHDPVPPAQLQPDVAADLQVICLKCLHKTPSDRYASAAALAADLEAFLEGEPIAARSFTALEKFVRVIHQHKLDERVGPLGTLLLAMAPFCVLFQVAGYWLFHASPRFPEIITVISVGAVVGFRVAVILANLPILSVLPRLVRRRLLTVGGVNTICCVLMPAMLWLTMPPDQPERLYLAYPVLILLTVQALSAISAEMGMFYLVALLFLGTAVVTMFVPFWSPMILGLFAAGQMVIQGLFFRAVHRSAKRKR